ncbi:hypothetical protein NECAME_10970 [Necator americanus]|uniref:SXP/RAL-2 family protein Ani s 5-like cation-binding domain-containing protein n=1 Tax=Necator americanus TaxID=51031 RepID=W2T8N6_NECAM|nr:hypothetical protein NECAME_10970 [Necator americanus]ETN77561.1 hypothetical protein NECAME_10970 [Necator americanus]
MHRLLQILAVSIVLARTTAWRGNKVRREEFEDPQLHYHHKMPPFLKNVSEDARWEFYQITRDLTTSMNQKMEKIRKWAEEQKVSDAVEKWFKQMGEFWKDVDKNTVRVLKELPSAYPKVYEIWSDMDLTPKEMYRKFRKLGLDRAVARSLHEVSMVVIHSDAHDHNLNINMETFLEKLIGEKFDKHLSRHHFQLAHNSRSTKCL